MKARIAAVAALVAVLSGCATTPAPSTAVVIVGTGLEFRVQLATTPDQQRDGLSGRDELSEGTGMLFTFDGPAERQVWMAGMEIPIDIAWILDGQVIATETLDPCTTETQDECPRWTSPAEADTLLEVPAGALDGIEPGTTVTTRKDMP
jgi:uncharacterized membrane protein (UPF0127 family)